MSEQVKPASEQKPVAWQNPVNGSVISDSHRIYLLEHYPRNKCEHVDPLYATPQPDYKAQRDALLDFANHIATSPKLVGTGWQEMAQMVVASAKGGAT